MTHRPRPSVCYLCGKRLLDSAPVNEDHVPAKQFFAPDLRRAHSPKLLKIEVHRACNSAFQRDEDYFVQTLIPMAPGSYAGNAIFRHAIGSYHRGKNVGLVRQVLGEFEKRPSGLTLPTNKIAKRFDGARIARVAFKIVRGLYFHHHGVALPADLNTSVRLVQPGHRAPDDFVHFMRTDDNVSHGLHQGVFAYRFRRYVVFEGRPTEAIMHYWSLLFWDRIIFIVTFEDPPTGPADKRTVEGK